MTTTSSRLQLQNKLNADLDRMVNITAFKTNNINTLVKNTDGVTCKICKSDNVNVIQKQIRSADEGSTNFYTCIDCGNKWRRNN
jgi:DNA-directed RNA polymerase subunit M/transcription elongation factor TFIIS